MEADKREVYIELLVRSLSQKSNLLDKLIAYTRQQKPCIGEDIFEESAFYDLIEQKQEILAELEHLDGGFQKLYERVKEELKADKDNYQEEIRQMQRCIAEITEKGIRLRGMEQEVKVQLETYIQEEKRNIASFHKRNSASTQYYRNMNQLQTNESYFVDRKR